MIVKSFDRIGLVGLCAVMAWGMPSFTQPAHAQGAFIAPPSAVETLAGSSTGSASGNVALGRARALQGGPGGSSRGPGGGPGGPGGPGGASAMPGSTAPGPAAPGGLPGNLQQLMPTITVISGTRVLDAVSGELLDDATERQVPESEKNAYYDDGTHGDAEPNDGKYTRVDESREFLSQTNHKIKQELIQALVSANSMTPLNFHGFRLMSTDRVETASRDRAWKLIPDPQGVGMMIKDVPIDKPLVVPKYREKQIEQDQKIKGDWADRFLQEFRQTKDSLTSEFYPLYIPTPPVPPATMPPAGWRPFAATTPASVAMPAMPAIPAARANVTVYSPDQPMPGNGYTNTGR